jgi:hypothetical protein
MISENIFYTFLYIWVGLGILLFPLLLKITVPYGRHTKNRNWGPCANIKLAWFLMEINVIVVFSWLFFTGPVEKTLPLYIFYGAFILHYINRTFVFPLQMKNNGNRMPWIVVLLGILFNLINGFFNGYWFGWLTPVYPQEWLQDPRFIIGAILFITGMMINISADQKLLHLRKGGRKGYYIPYGGLFEYISSPNLFGEIIEWLGWAMMSWCLSSFSFAVWTIVNLIPRALDHHRWYKRNFPDYPGNRRAIFPFLL